METDLKKFVGQRLQLLRLEKNLTQEQMGEKLSLSTSAYCKIEYGETDLTLTRLNKIAEVLNMSALDLFRKIDGNSYINNSSTIGTSIGVARDLKIESPVDLRELIKANSKMIDMLCRRIEMLENKLQ
ncbi:helix-turn-helix transcriptional regulator [Bacteroides stercorirosoris]|jgi:transcriptional regulator with XRE-family HTH domain|uniref:DNA-binding transcriptional regulator, XRE-family HTH domain n=1 Tax=Bacteroides stercorirosoris TaxID=871324 RepID=A0A1M6DG93_9BACE|nr:helix-turn-helix transcriptional regulator [Bacteroides stercorirosoris]OKZ09497.1 MAG: transcriptional regulator [Bacteroides oleiciplenus]RGX79541.1 XRE family transcriptional regulator [Bacteroides stercorirosoris]SHI72357.1 DNA-binding transcriptional regulator, XRE-family HTH domain [Bacteroides stercorirosoris]